MVNLDRKPLPLRGQPVEAPPEARIQTMRQHALDRTKSKACANTIPRKVNFTSDGPFALYALYFCTPLRTTRIAHGRARAARVRYIPYSHTLPSKYKAYKANTK